MYLRFAEVVQLNLLYIQSTRSLVHALWYTLFGTVSMLLLYLNVAASHFDQFFGVEDCFYSFCGNSGGVLFVMFLIRGGGW